MVDGLDEMSSAAQNKTVKTSILKLGMDKSISTRFFVSSSFAVPYSLSTNLMMNRLGKSSSSLLVDVTFASSIRRSMEAPAIGASAEK